MQHFSVLFVALWATHVYGQQDLLSSIAGGIGDTSLTTNCGSTFQSANASGNIQINPGVVSYNTDSGYANPIDAGVTVLQGGGNQSANSIQWSIWYATGGANYSDDLSLGYDVCAFTFSTYTLNTLLRAQSDSGNCVATLDQDCVSALESAASSYADGLVLNATPNPNSNLSADSLSKVCYEVGQSLEQNFPSECQKFMNSSLTLQIGAIPLTSNHDSPLDNGCNITNNDNGDEYNLVYTLRTLIPAGQQSTFYTVFNWQVLPTILTFLPVANINAQTSIGGSNSKMACLRATTVSPGSEKPAPAPTPTPLGSGGLSGGAIAGIVVGVVVGLALIAGAAFWFWRRRKAQRKQTSAEASAGDHPPAYADAKEQPTPVAEAPADAGVKELSPDSEVRPELAGADKPELKRGNTDHPYELPAEIANPNSRS